MEWSQIIFLAVLQGITEFLPISSSAHLILVPYFTPWSDQGLAMDVAVHVGTLMAVIGYFRCEIQCLLRDGVASLVQRRQVGESFLAWGVVVGTVPLGIVGLVYHDFIETHLRSVMVIAVATLVFGLLLGWADLKGARRRSEQQLNWKDIVIIGGAQALALIPGTSRSGITMTAGLMLGLTRSAAARFSFLLSIPAILAAGSLQTLKLVESAEPVAWDRIVVATALAGVTAYLSIHYFLKLLDRIGMWPFVVYRVVLAALLFMVAS